LIIMLLAVGSALYFGQGIGGDATDAAVTDTVTVERTITVKEVDPALAAALDDANGTIKDLRRRLANLRDKAQDSGQEAEVKQADTTGPPADQCAAQLLVLQRRIRRQEETLQTADLLIEALNEELKPKQDTGRHVTSAYDLAYQITHSGRIAPNGFRYQLRLTPKASATYRPNSASLLAGVVASGVPVYGVQYGYVRETMLGIVQVQYPLGVMGGVGVRW